MRLAAFSPSDPSLADFPRRLARAKKSLENHGIELIVPAAAMARTGYTAGSPEHRAAEINRLAADPGIDGIIASLGGFNSNGILPYLDFDLFAQRPFPVIGNSDVTALLIAIWSRTSRETYLGPALLPDWGEWPAVQLYDAEGLTKALSGKAFQFVQAEGWTAERGDWTNPEQGTARPRSKATCWRALRDGHGTGTVFGGNVETLNMLVGTPFWMPPERPLVCLEATGPEAHLPRFERALTHLLQAGLFDNAAGLIIGRMPDAVPISGTALDEVLLRVFRNTALPIAAGLDFGHSSPMATLPIGRQATLMCAESTVQFHLAAASLHQPESHSNPKGTDLCKSSTV